MAPPLQELARTAMEQELTRVPKTKGTLACRSQPELPAMYFPARKLVAQSRWLCRAPVSVC